MLIQESTYADYAVIVKAFKEKPTVFTWDGGAGGFLAYAIFAFPSLIVYGGFATKPATFDTDFPDAVSLTAPFNSLAG